MNAYSSLSQDLQALFDDYLSGDLDDVRLQALEDRLRCNPETRRHFVLYCRMHTDLHLEMRAGRAGTRALDAICEQEMPNSPVPRRPRIWRWLTAAAVLLVAVGGALLWNFGRENQATAGENIAWLVNAQDCQWANGQAPAGDMRAGKVVRLESGLAEIRFHIGAQVVLEGPASLELLSGNSARLLRGKLSATVPAAAKGFQIISPHGKVVDLGTEFAMSVAPNDWTDVYVFTGKVEAFAGSQHATQTLPFSVQEKQGVRIDAAGVALTQLEVGQEGKEFVRAIVPSARPVPRTFAFDFHQPAPGTLADAAGLGIGLTHRLPGTGARLPGHDGNLRLDTAQGHLTLKTTKSDINTSYRLDTGEYLGVRLADYGFTGKEDFALTVVVPSIPELPKLGQFGLYAGLHSKLNIRGGMISTGKPGQYEQFVVENQDGRDTSILRVGLGFTGDDIRLTLRRAGSNYSLTADNLTTANSTSVAMPEPEFLEGESDFYVGFFGANTQSNERRTLLLKEFKVTVWTVTTPSN